MKKNKVMMGFAAVVVIGGLVAGGLKVSADKQHKEDVAKAQSEVTIVVNKTKAEGPIQIALADLHDEAIPTFLKAGIKQADIDAVAKLITTEEDVLKKIKKEYTEVNTKLATDDLAALTNQLKVIQQKFDVNEAVNKQFKQEEKKVALSGNTRVTGIPLADETTKETVEATKKLIEGLPEDDFLTGVNGLLKEADSQLAQIDVATKKTEALYDKDKVKPDAKRSDYDLAVKETKKIRRESTKKDLNTKLDAVKKVIEDREKKEADKKAKETADAQKQQASAKNTPATTEEPANESTGEDTYYAANDGGQASSNGYDTGGNDWSNENTANNTSGGSNWSGNTSSTGGGTTVGGSPNTGSTNSGGNSGGGSTGNNTTPPVTETPQQPEEPSGPPAGWVLPEFAIGSDEFWNDLFDKGYSGYRSSGNYVQYY
jgi:hypothetical protein